MVGHEPTWSALIAVLTGASVRFPTAALATIELDRPWGEIGPGAGTLSGVVLSRELEASGG